MKSIVSDLLNITQKAAIAAYPWIGRGKKDETDGASTNVMRNLLNQTDIEGVIVIGEGEMDKAPMLYINEKVGTGSGPIVDIAVDPVDGTTCVAQGQGDAITVMAVAEKGGLLHAPDMYMKKIAVGPKASQVIDIERPLTDNLKAVAKSLGKPVSDLNIMVQDRERHQSMIDEIRQIGSKAKLFSNVDITCAVSTAIIEKKIDMFVGIGGAPEGVIAATGLKCLGGNFQAQLLPKNELEYQRCVDMGITYPNQPLKLDDIVKTENCFFTATGVTDGFLLKGVEEYRDYFITHSFSATGRHGHYQFIKTVHSHIKHHKSNQPNVSMA
ncbi:class II fructose-bisphosphatase [Scopulibacillus cellulosilyticus]|uniref:Fructose-1,6-bisphosphatase n=1 Tax=Scopulibacillus cellulosilyticus TaxID=2665665 RepID=A0ABW2PXD3_9BACL